MSAADFAPRAMYARDAASQALGVALVEVGGGTAVSAAQGFDYSGVEGIDDEGVTIALFRGRSRSVG